MRRSITLSLVFLLAIASLATGRAVAHAAHEGTPDHPIVGAWQLDSDADDPDNPPALAVFNADGTLVELHERESDGAGIWTAIDDQTAMVTIVFHQVNADLELEGTATVYATVTITGDTFTSPYTVELVGPDGTVLGSEQGTATATRIVAIMPTGTPAATPVS